MKKNKSPILITLFFLLNLLISVDLSYAFASVSGNINISPCTSGCLTLTTPASLSIEANAPQFITNQSKNLYFYSHYDQPGGKVSISNASENTGFALSVTATPLTNADHTFSIPYTQIGIASFNSGLDGSIDSSRVVADTPIESAIDPVIFGQTTEPFDQATLQNHLTNGDDIKTYYTYFSGTDPSSSVSIPIIPVPPTDHTPTDHNSMGTFNFGLSVIIKIPDSSIDLGLVDGTYNSTLTFTLTTTTPSP